MKTELVFLIKRLCDLEAEFSILAEDEKELVIVSAEEMTGGLTYLVDALDEYYKNIY
ncbi:MAG: hypothetical protein ACRCU3_05780 [Eubacteriaceae bacterium]